MAFEQYQNLANSTSTGTLNNSDNPVTIVVASGSGALFPATTNGPFRITVSNTDGSNAEVMAVTTRSTDTLTAQRGTTISTYGIAESPTPALTTHTAGSVVSHNVTAGGVRSILGNWSGYGAIASLPGTAGAQSGMRYQCSDAPYEFVFNGTAWIPFAGNELVGLPSTAFASGVFANQLSGTAATDHGLLQLDITPIDGAGAITCYLVPVPTPPYKIWTRFYLWSNESDGDDFAGVCWSNGTATDANIQTFVSRTTGTPFIYDITNISSPSFTTGRYDPGTVLPGGNMGVKGITYGLEDDNTNRSFVVCPNHNLASAIPIVSIARTTFITPTHIGVCIRQDTSGAHMRLTVEAWTAK